MRRCLSSSPTSEKRPWHARGAHPATVEGTERGREHAGLLRFDFPPKDAKLTEISWDEFFEKFEDAGLALLYQERTADGEVSRFHKFVDRDRAEQG